MKTIHAYNIGSNNMYYRCKVYDTLLLIIMIEVREKPVQRCSCRNSFKGMNTKNERMYVYFHCTNIVNIISDIIVDTVYMYNNMLFYRFVSTAHL